MGQHYVKAYRMAVAIRCQKNVVFVVATATTNPARKRVTSQCSDSEAENRKRWTRNIPRKDSTPSNRSVVCIKHFEECGVSRVEIYKDSDGNCHEFPRQRPLL
ncbi:uncharacterized protein LOC126426738 [Schistocerca serialis cubense]|uniref:uncharacterized protein LOC126426738 n=1 Tax=Schistocerca serialis cubense TaxID=2023355 RepID=UPI00214DFCBE|nr:uncharacterized protein LOC126426738 [Schistocerca serialis cubense]